ncbi:MAG: hypothetical protein CMJ18_15280 [Phycisphaeraceae bacterium]|nr:hypothetical protein [Phycisphaeraceae bacterium]
MNVGNSMTYLVTDTDSSVSAQTMFFGGAGSGSPGGTAAMTVSDSGHVGVTNDTQFFTATSSLTVNGGTFSTGTLTNDPGVISTISITDPVGGTALTVGTNDGDSTFDGLIQDATGSGSLKKTGNGTLTLTGDNSYTGGTIIDGGNLALGHSNAAGFGPITVLGSTIDYAGTVNIDNDIELQNDVTLNVDTGTATQGRINESGGSYGITKTGSGNLNLSKNNTFSGATIISAGRIRLGNANALRNSTVSVNVDNGLAVNFQDTTVAGLAGNGDLNIGSRRFRVDGSAETEYTGSITGTIGSQLIHETGGSLTLSGVDSVNTLFLTKIESGGRIVLTEGASLSGSLNIGSFGDGDLTLQSGATVSLGSGLLGGEFGDDGIALVTGNGSSWFSRGLQLGGQHESVRGGTGTLTIEESGDVLVDGETEFLSSVSSITVNGGTFTTDRLTNHPGVTATISISDIDLNTPALTVGLSNGSSTFDGLIEDASSAGSLKKIAPAAEQPGALTLTGANTYTGGTIIEGGKLLANNTTGSATGTGGVTVTENGTLGGTGSSAATTTVNAGGTVAPGEAGPSLGVLTVDDVVFETGSTFAAELAGAGGVEGTDFDQLIVNNTAMINGGMLDLSYVDAFTAAPGDSFLILVAGDLLGAFDLIDFPVGQQWFATYNRQVGTLTVGVVPEPASGLLLALGLVTASSWCRCSRPAR